MKTQFKLISIAMIAAVTALLASCTGSKVDQFIDSVNDECPVSTEFGVLTELSSADNTVAFNYTVDNKIIPLPKLKANPEVVKKMWKITFLDDKDPAKTEFVNQILAQGMGVKLTFNDNNQNFGITIGNNELKSLLKQKIPDNEQIQIQIDITKLNLPKQLDEMTTMVDIKLENDFVTYCYDINDEVLPLSEMQGGQRDNIVYGIKGELAQNSPMAIFFKMVTDMGKGLRYQYHGTKSGETVNIDFNNGEMRQLFSTKTAM